MHSYLLLSGVYAAVISLSKKCNKSVTWLCTKNAKANRLSFQKNTALIFAQKT